MKKCTVEKCTFKDYYAKGLCHVHYERLRRYGRLTIKSQKCSYNPCKKITWEKYCKFHQARIDNDIPLNTPKGWQVRGERNIHWRGGVSEYPNHWVMKKNRKLIFKQYNNKCADCGKKAQQIHHKDNSKNNHTLKNLVPLCFKCHGLRGVGRKNLTSKYLNKYGMGILEISKIMNMSLVQVSKLHDARLLKYLLFKYHNIKKRKQAEPR